MVEAAGYCGCLSFGVRPASRQPPQASAANAAGPSSARATMARSNSMR